MDDLFVFLFTFVIVFIVYLIIYFVYKGKGKLDKLKGFDLLIGKYKLKNVNYDKMGLILVLVNSLIISISGTLCTMVDFSYVWQLLIGFALLMAFIYIFYSLLGKFLKKKEVDKDEHKRNRKKVAKKMGRK